MTSAWALKLGAVALTLLGVLGSTAYVLTHVKNPAAPMQPPVALRVVVPSPRPDGRPQLLPRVRIADLPPLTSTYVS